MIKGSSYHKSRMSKYLRKAYLNTWSKNRQNQREKYTDYNSIWKFWISFVITLGVHNRDAFRDRSFINLPVGYLVGSLKIEVFLQPRESVYSIITLIISSPTSSLFFASENSYSIDMWISGRDPCLLIFLW